MHSASKLAFVASLCLPALGHAADSSWLLCKGIATHGDKASAEKTYFAASVLEHRGASGDTRDLEVTLIYGDHVSRGTSLEKQAGGLKVRDVNGKHAVTFTGTGALSMAMDTFTLKGKIDFSFGNDPKAKLEPFAATLACERLDDLAIGH